MFLLIRFKIVLQKQLLFQCPQKITTGFFMRLLLYLLNQDFIPSVYS